MSVWTHVSATIRIDDLSFISSRRNIDKDVEKIIGPMSTFDEYNDKTKLPLGSEGSIEYCVYTNTKENDLARFVVSFWGDLRDYQNLKKIKKWFSKLCAEINNTKKTNMLIRDAVLKAKIEVYNQPLLLMWDEDTNKIEEVDVKC